MKKIAFLFLIAIGLFIAGCGGNEQQSNSNAQPANPPGQAAPADGKGVFQRTCIVCHQPDGTGIQGTYPPLAKSDFLLANKARAIIQVLKGSSNEIMVNGSKYAGVMPAQSNLKDDEVAAVLTYVTHDFGNNGYNVTEADVKAVKDSLASAAQKEPYGAGKAVYEAKCQSCHKQDGSAARTFCPPLANSDYLIADKTRAIKQILNGTSEEITVNGKKYTGTMSAQQLSDKEVADVLNYITHNFGNNGYTVTGDDVKATR